MSVNFNPFSPFVHFVDRSVLPRVDAVADTVLDKASSAAGGLGSVRDTVRDDLVKTWNGVPGNEQAERWVGDLTDKLPFNNAATAGLRALAGQKDITLDRDAVAGIQNDPDFKTKETDINDAVVAAAKNNPAYGQSDFDIPLSTVYPKTEGNVLLALGGTRGNEPMLHQLEHAWDLSDPEIRKTWGVAGNEQTWLLRHCTLNGVAHVSKDGTIRIDYRVNDTLDLTAQHGRGGAYNDISTAMGTVWHGVLGAAKPQLTATFTRTVPGTGPVATPSSQGTGSTLGVVTAGGTPTNLQPQRSDTSFAQGLRGAQPQSGDLTFARMANDVYSLPTKKDAQGRMVTGTDSEAALASVGWHRMEASGDGKSLRSANGGQLAIDPQSLEDGKTGLRSAVYTDGKGHFVMAFAGTDPGQAGDILADAEQGTGMRNVQYDQALALSDRLTDLAGADNVAFTGHSLGGGLAAAASANTGAPAVTFNAAGVSIGSLKAMGFAPDAARADFLTSGQIRSYSVDGDPMTTADESGLPEQLGAQWHAAWHKSGVNPNDPRDIIALHGGSGNGQSFVKIMEQAQFRSGFSENPYVGTALNMSGPSDAARALAIAELGNVGTQSRGLLGDLLQIGSDTRTNVHNDLDGDDKFGFLGLPRDLARGAWHVAGDAKDSIGNLIDGTVTNYTDQYASRS